MKRRPYAPRLGRRAFRPERELQHAVGDSTPITIMQKLVTAALKLLPPGTHVALVCAPADLSVLATAATLPDQRLAAFLRAAATSAEKSTTGDEHAAGK